MVIAAPYRNDKPYDEYLESTFKQVRNHIQDKNDDYLCLTIGSTGSGKSTLNLHILEIYMPFERLNINQVALSREEFASSLKSIAEEPKPRALLYDEANVNKRDSMTTWNKDILDLYMACRGLNVLHLWANPTLNLIDKSFIEDRLRGVILIRGKEANIRSYFFFRKADILNIYRKYGTLSIDILNRVRRKYAWYRGWFKDYNGVLKQPYLIKKENRMKIKVERFFEKYGEDGFTSPKEVMKALDIHDMTLSKYREMLTEEVHYKVSPTGRYKYSKEGVEKLKELMRATGRKKFLKYKTGDDVVGVEGL